MNRHIIRTIITTIITLTVIVAPIFAGGSQEADTTAKAEEKVINVFAYQFNNETPKAQYMAEAYMASHPGTTITVEEYPWDSYFQNLEVRFGADNPDFDVVIMDIPMIANYAERGFIKDLTTVIDKDRFEDKIAPSCLASCTYNGKIMASPLQNSDQYLFINKSIAKEAGVTLPSVVVDAETVITAEFAKKWAKAAWTWKEAVAAAQKMVKDSNDDGITDVYGLHIEQAGRLYQLQPLGGSRGGKICSPDGTTVKGYLDQSEWYQAVKFYGDLFNTYKVEVPGSFIPGYDPISEFLNGSYGMMVGGGWNIKRIFESGLDVVIAAHPYFEDGTSTTPTGSWVIGMSSKIPAQREALATDFIDWWSISDEGSKTWYDTQGELPATKYMLDQLSRSEQYDPFPLCTQRLGVYQIMNTAEGRPVTPYYTFINDGFEKAFINSAQGVDPKKALNDAVEEIEKNIKRVQ